MTGLLGDENDEILPLDGRAVHHHGYYWLEYDMPPTGMLMWLTAELAAEGEKRLHRYPQAQARKVDLARGLLKRSVVARCQRVGARAAFQNDVNLPGTGVLPCASGA